MSLQYICRLCGGPLLPKEATQHVCDECQADFEDTPQPTATPGSSEQLLKPKIEVLAHSRKWAGGFLT